MILFLVSKSFIYLVCEYSIGYQDSQLTIYLSFICNVLKYGWQLGLYDNSSGKTLKKLENVQKEALLSITRAYKKTSQMLEFLNTLVKLNVK